tara:strand:+ start:1987 stop:2124 length:138 start_codon:yes stop_codon:yes gene_type:complete
MFWKKFIGSKLIQNAFFMSEFFSVLSIVAFFDTVLAITLPNQTKS